MEHTDPRHKKFQAGDIIRLNPKNEFYEGWCKDVTCGPFQVMSESTIKRLSDGAIIPCGRPTSWWAVLDTFLDAAKKAQTK